MVLESWLGHFLGGLATVVVPGVNLLEYLEIRLEHIVYIVGRGGLDS